MRCIIVIFNVSVFKFLFFSLYFLSVVAAENLSYQRLAWQMEGGDVRSIAGLCRQYVQKKLEAEKTFSVESLLKDRELAQACYMAHFFALVGKDRTYILHELKDKEYVLWLLNHPEVFEKLSFAKASGKDTLAVLRNIWLKEGKELSGVGLNMALGAALVSSSREPEACEARYDFYKKSFMEKKLFPQFLTLEPWEFGILFRGRESIEELAWAQDYLADKKKIQAGNECLLADPCVGAQRGDRRCFEILPDRIIAKFFDRAVDPAVPVSAADPGSTSFLSADDTILLLVFQRVDS